MAMSARIVAVVLLLATQACQSAPNLDSQHPLSPLEELHQRTPADFKVGSTSWTLIEINKGPLGDGVPRGLLVSRTYPEMIPGLGQRCLELPLNNSADITHLLWMVRGSRDLSLDRASMEYKVSYREIVSHSRQ